MGLLRWQVMTSTSTSASARHVPLTWGCFCVGGPSTSLQAWSISKLSQPKKEKKFPHISFPHTVSLTLTHRSVARIFQRRGHTVSKWGYSPDCHVMAVSQPIVGCLVKKGLGGHGHPRTPPGYALEPRFKKHCLGPGVSVFTTVIHKTVWMSSIVDDTEQKGYQTGLTNCRALSARGFQSLCIWRSHNGSSYNLFSRKESPENLWINPESF